MDTCKSLSTIWLILANDRCNSRDINTFIRRADNEQEEFLFTILPMLGKDILRSFSTGRLVVTARFKIRKGTGLPVFLHGAFRGAYEKDGTLRDLEQAAFLRQLCMMFYKFETPVSPEGEKEAWSKFKKTDLAVKQDNWPSDLDTLRENFRELFPQNPLDIRPHHASGATADKYSNAEKRSVRRFIPSLHKIFDFVGTHFNTAYHASCWRDRTKSVVYTNPPARFATVPKDSRGPRTICIEPHERMFVQKGLMQKLYDHLESTYPSKGRVNFTDQSINRDLCFTSSKDRRYATIDLKDASDMVSWSLIKNLAPFDWLAAFSATRSTHVAFNDELVELNKFAPMGSALCFPVEAMLFFSICRLVTDDVFVYGDDIIVPVASAQDVMNKLAQYGLIVNIDKSFTTGPFRESCGAEYVDGVDVSVVMLRSLDHNSLITYLNLLTIRYGTETSQRCFEGLAKESMIPRGTRCEPLSGLVQPEPFVFYTDVPGYNEKLKTRWNEFLQRTEVRAKVNRVTDEKGGVEGHDLFFDWLTVSENSSSPQEAGLILYLDQLLGNPVKGISRSEHLRNLFSPRGGKSDPDHWFVESKQKFDWTATQAVDHKFSIFQNRDK